tara:strand:- start:75 stop:1775 length:1701 start_codon:yes stop_codon:yes gene_type:complete
MISVSGKNWEEIFFKKRLVEKIKLDHNFSEILSKILVFRNFSETEIYSINNHVKFSNPFLHEKDFLKASDILIKHIRQKNDILVIGDYDVDGCVSTSLLINFLNKLKIKNSYYIPNRFIDGYGASLKLIKKILKKKIPKLIIMVDCGSNSYQAVEYLDSINIETIIIDHHNITIPKPKANAFINPKKKMNFKYYNHYCSAFLTYLFIDIFKKKNDIKIDNSNELIFVAIACIADVMPCRENNRYLLIEIFKNFNVNKNLILKTFYELDKKNKKFEFDDISYLFAPIMNSAGRIDDANKVVELLISSNKKKIREISSHLFEINLKRKKLQNTIIENLDLKNYMNENGIIFHYDSKISEGLIGIIASKICEYFNQPTIVFTKSGNFLKGSARSIPSFNIGQYIKYALDQKILVSGGGHNLAAGVLLHKNKIKLFKKFLDEIFKKQQHLKYNRYVSRISLNAVNNHFFNEINQLSPFGNQNSKIIFLIENVKIIKPQIIKNNLISCLIKSKSNKFHKAVLFSPVGSPISINLLNQKKELDILVKINKNQWNNKTSIQLEIVDLIYSNNA